MPQLLNTRLCVWQHSPVRGVCHGAAATAAAQAQLVLLLTPLADTVLVGGLLFWMVVGSRVEKDLMDCTHAVP